MSHVFLYLAFGQNGGLVKKDRNPFRKNGRKISLTASLLLNGKENAVPKLDPHFARKQVKKDL